MKFKYIIPVLAAVAAVSCQKADQEFDSNLDPNAVRIEATVGGVFTRSNPLEEGAASSVFKTNDVVAVVADAQAAVNYTYDGTTWSAETDKYLRWDTPTMTFKAWYPQTASMTDFVLPINQSTTAGIESADYMTYSGDHIRDGITPINLTLQRKTARVILKIASYGDEYAENERTVSDVKIHSGASGYSAGVVSTDVRPVTCYANSTNDTFTALVIPTVANTTENFVELVDGKVNTLLTKGIPAMEAGKSYTYNLRVGKDEVAITGITVNDWATGEVIPDGDAEVVIKPQIGFYYFEDGTYGSDLSAGKPIGIVFWIDPTNPTKGKIVSLDEKNNIPWTINTAYYTNYDTKTSSTLNGLDNMAAIISIDSDYSDFPPFAWCAEKTLGGLTWYLPASKELLQLFAASCGLRWVESGADPSKNEIDDWADWEAMPNNTNYVAARTAFNARFTAANGVGGTILNQSDEYLSSTQAGTSAVWTVYFGRGDTWNDDRDFASHARAIAKF